MVQKAQFYNEPEIKPEAKTVERISASPAFTIRQEKAQIAQRIASLQRRYDELTALQPLQGNLKDLSEREYNKLKKSLIG